MNTQQLHKLVDCVKEINQFLEADALISVSRDGFLNPETRAQISSYAFNDYLDLKEIQVNHRANKDFPYEVYFLEDDIRFFAIYKENPLKK
ncbi:MULTISPECIES: hypothetical protein [unclassified Virgibacillus]|uniref:hypothetical protein n=1 Tax=unclassified Virgibacillus TaxID=2620237 RepID=UPI00090CCB4F|nr:MULTISPECIES: hypothetical protein [unclassified Virgibacillus]API92678.1 hypothetical protein BKP57_13210 [Virgibacillus sp. 6R]MBS7428172.1 hypothetical protein [Virgibacillus sp. 19R1-5]